MHLPLLVQPWHIDPFWVHVVEDDLRFARTKTRTCFHSCGAKIMAIVLALTMQVGFHVPNMGYGVFAFGRGGGEAKASILWLQCALKLSCSKPSHCFTAHYLVAKQ